MIAVPALTDCVGFMGTTLTPHMGFSVTSTLTDPLSVTPGYSLYVAVSDACPLPTVAPVYDTVTLVEAPAAIDADEGDTEHEPSDPLHDCEKAAVAVRPPVFVTVNA